MLEDKAMFRKELAFGGVRAPGALLAAATLLIAFAGCSANKVTAPAKQVPLTLLSVGAGANRAGSLGATPAGRTPFHATAGVDPLPVTFTKALLVVRDVRFKLTEGAESDSAETDSTEGEGEIGDRNELGDHDSTGVHEGDDHSDDGEGAVVFHGPFVIDLLTQSAESLDTEMVPPGDYRRVQGHLRPLRADDWNASHFDFLIGSTVYLQGTVDGDGGGPFTYQARIDNQFQIRGKFTVQANTPATAFIVFDLSTWLRGRNGAFLDPRLPENDQAIRSAIRHSIKVGMDDNHDGEDDDDMHAEGE